MRTVTADVVDPTSCRLGEGPIWHDGTLHWVDIEGRAIHRLGGDPIPTDLRPGCLVFDDRGRRVVGFDDGVHLETGAGWERIVALDPDDPTTRLNDGKVAPDGRLVVGTMTENQADRRGWLWAVDVHGGAEVLLEGVAVSNGLAWSGDHLWYVDSPSRKVRRFAWPPPLGEPTAVIRIPADRGFPDGMCVDDDGCLWVAHWGGGIVARYTPDGDLDTVVGMPTPQVTSCAFDEGTTLYITTAAEGRPDDPAAGRTYAVDVGIGGPAPRSFGVGT
jgi:sugar lactone lactonase YvrE